MRLIQITDLHLSERTDTPAYDALEWAIAEANRRAPDLVAITGDMTTYGTAPAARHFLEAATKLTVPWVFTPGNAELRDAGAMPVLAECLARRSLAVDGVGVLLPDTSGGRLSEFDRSWLDDEARAGGPLILLTHYPIDVLDEGSRAWIESWLTDHHIELYLAGHRHFDRSRSVSGSREVITRGLDPDKAFGGPPGINLFERRADGSWSEEAIPWPHETALLPAQTEHSPVGWSIHGDPAATIRETRDAGLHVVELRPRELDYDVAAIIAEVELLRGERTTYLSWHLPNLRWNPNTGMVVGVEDMVRQIDHARACGVDAFTVHVPRIKAAPMFEADGGPSAAWARFLECYEDLFRDAVAAGVCVSIENIHNNPGTPLDPAQREFATEIGEYLAWIDAVADRLSDGSRVGAHFDVGHARNNGALGNRQPLSDWYARIGSRITGYHIHQVRPHEETGKLTNHRDIKAVYDRTISYAGFLHAWSRHTINRAPLFVEVRDAQERRQTTRLLESWFSATG